MSVVIAKNRTNGLIREFSQMQWNLLGKNKGYWVEVNPEPVQKNESTESVILETGEKKKLILDNNINVLEEVSIVHSPVSYDEVKKKEAFEKACVNINKGRLKDFLDKQGIPYEQNFKTKQLIEVFGRAVNYNKQVVKENF